MTVKDCVNKLRQIRQEYSVCNNASCGEALSMAIRLIEQQQVPKKSWSAKIESIGQWHVLGRDISEALEQAQLDHPGKRVLAIEFDY